MEHETEEELLEQYLLGELAEEKQAEVEERFFADNSLFEQLLIAESTLIDEYASGELRQDARERVEALLHSSPQQRRELDYTKELINAFSEPRPASAGEGQAFRWSWLRLLQTPLVQASLAASALLIAVSVYLLVWSLGLRHRIGDLQGDLTMLRTEQQRAVEQVAEEKDLNKRLREELDLKRQEPVHDRGPAEIASLLLTPDYIMRGSTKAPKAINLRPTARRLKIQVDLNTADTYEKYRVLIQTYNGRQVWNSEVRPTGRANNRGLTLALPVNLLPSDDYILTVKGSRAGGAFVDLEDYAFGVRR